MVPIQVELLPQFTVVSKTPSNKTVLAPQERFMILFKTLNSGNTFWPAGLVVKMKKGNLHDLKKKKNEIVSEQGVGSGMTYDWMLKLKAPKNPGTYSAEFEMYTEQGTACKNYGSKVKFDI